MANKMQKAFEEKAFGKPTIVPRFFEHARKDNTRSTGYGITIYNASTYLEIKTSGRRDTTTRQATDADKAMFHEHYAKYTEDMSVAMPMEALAGYNKANLFILRDLDIFTVEELAEYEGKLPLASLKLMHHCAGFLVQQMQMYQPPSYQDDIMEVPRETVQAQRQVLPAHQTLGAANSEAGNNGSGVQRYGVSLDEEGNITEVHGQEVGQEKGQQEKVQKAINFY